MNPIAPYAAITLAGLVLIAAAMDLWKREIPNWLTLAGIAAGIALNPWQVSLAGLGVAALIFLPLFMLRWLGGGDVKLMGAVGALAGYQNMLVIFVLDALFGGLVALVAVLLRGRLLRTLKNIPRMLRREKSEELEAGNEKSMGLPRAVTIAAATLLLLWANQAPAR